jgi:hypothetical protein
MKSKIIELIINEVVKEQMDLVKKGNYRGGTKSIYFDVTLHLLVLPPSINTLNLQHNCVTGNCGIRQIISLRGSRHTR